MAFVTYKGYGICWLDYMECYWVYDLKSHRTVVYDDHSIEYIKKRLDEYC